MQPGSSTSASATSGSDTSASSPPAPTTTSPPAAHQPPPPPTSSPPAATANGYAPQDPYLCPPATTETNQPSSSSGERLAARTAGPPSTMASSPPRSPMDGDSDESIAWSDYSGFPATLPEREPQVDSAPGSGTDAPSEIRSDPEEELAPDKVEVQLYTVGGSDYTVKLDRDATMGQLVNKLRCDRTFAQLPPQHQDLTYCAVVTSSTNPTIYPLRFHYMRIMCTEPVTAMIKRREPVRLQLVSQGPPVHSLTGPIHKLRQRVHRH